jgi:phosphate:Na+ symporter
MAGMETYGTLFSGLGLFIIGVRFLSTNLKRFTGQQFKALMKRMTRTKFVSAVIGFMSGTFTQSGNASVFITTSLQMAGLLSINRSLTIINWANIGTAVLIFLVSINLKLFAFYLLGIIGLMYYLQMDKKHRFHVSTQVLLGLALLFLGVHFMKAAAKELENFGWVRGFIQLSSNNYLMLLFTGAMLTFIIQSSSAVTVIAISLSTSGLFQADQTFVIVAGTSLGSAANIIFLSGSLTGTSKQLSLYQAMFKASGALFALLLFMVIYLLKEQASLHLTSVPLTLGHQTAFLYLFMVAMPTFLMTFLQGPVIKLLNKMSPPTQSEMLSKPQFIFEQALDDPETALDLVNKEQIRLLRFFPLYLTQISSEKPVNQLNEILVYHEGFKKVTLETETFLNELSKKPDALVLHERILFFQNTLQSISMLEQSLYEMVQIVEMAYEKVHSLSYTSNLIESLRAITDTAIEGIESNEMTDLEITRQLTAEKGGLLNRIRTQHLSADQALDMEMKQLSYSMTIQFERIIWQLRSLNQLRMNPR